MSHVSSSSLRISELLLWDSAFLSAPLNQKIACMEKVVSTIALRVTQHSERLKTFFPHLFYLYSEEEGIRIKDLPLPPFLFIFWNVAIVTSSVSYCSSYTLQFFDFLCLLLEEFYQAARLLIDLICSLFRAVLLFVPFIMLFFS